MKRCPKCGGKISVIQNYCSCCGCKLNNINSESAKKSSKSRISHMPKLICASVIILLLAGGFIYYRCNTYICPFGKLSANYTQDTVRSILGYPNGSSHISHYDFTLYYDVYEYEFMNNTAPLQIVYDTDRKIFSARFDMDYPLSNPSVLDRSTLIADEVVDKVAGEIIKFYTKKYGGYRIKNGKYVWRLAGGETITLKYDSTPTLGSPIELEWRP